MHVNRIMTARSKYFNHFEVEEGKATCKACQSAFPYSSRIGTNSLRNHMRSKHPDVFHELNKLWQPSLLKTENQSSNEHTSDLLDIKSNANQLKLLEDSSSSNSNFISKPIRRRKFTQHYLQRSNGFSLDLSALGINAGQSLPRYHGMPDTSKLEECNGEQTLTIQQRSNLNEPIYSQALLDAMTRSDDSLGLDQSVKHDVEIVARNLNGVDDALFYLKTTSEIVKKWPKSKVRVFMQDLLKQAMDEDNKMRFASEQLRSI